MFSPQVETRLASSLFVIGDAGKGRRYRTFRCHNLAKRTECNLNGPGLPPPDYGANPKVKHYMTRSPAAGHRI